MKNRTRKTFRIKNFLKVVSWITVLVFSCEQIALADPALLNPQNPPAVQPVISVSSTGQTRPDTSSGPEAESTTTQFLGDNSPLSEASLAEPLSLEPASDIRLSTLKNLPEMPLARISSESTSGTTFRRQDNDEIALKYDFRSPEVGKAVLELRYQGVGYPPKPFIDLSQEESLEFGIKVYAQNVWMAFVDTSGNRTEVKLNTSSKYQTFFRIPTNQISGAADLSQISHILFELREADVKPGKETSDFTLFAKDLYSRNLVALDPSQDEYFRKAFSQNFTVRNISSSSYGRLLSSDYESFEMEFTNLKTKGMAVSIEMGDFDLSKNPYFAFSLQGDTSKVRVWIEDITGKNNTLYLNGVSGTDYKDFLVDLSRIASNGIDIEHIKSIKVYGYPNANYVGLEAGKLSGKFGFWEANPIQPLSGLLTNQVQYEFFYSVNGQAKSQIYQLMEGINEIEIADGGAHRKFQVELDTKAP
ncbi:MAG: hypothetical protein HY586_03645, partial [Candidatus Omnitrophica bacterium]|nr:hypothetical protein [Candidatus Omnitrophota bacterium]